jgi:glycyl-tRNA synthetase alpha subunit
MPCRIDKAFRYIMACCVLHNYYQLQGILKPIVRDMKQIGDPVLG